MAVSAETLLKRFIHYGNESATYVCVSKGATRHEFKEENLTAINSLMTSNPTNVEVITDIIMKAFDAGYSIHNEALIFALAMAARQKLSQNLRELAYVTARTICESAKDLFLFIHYCSQLAPGKGFGRGLNKVVQEWYYKQLPMELLKSVTSRNKYFGWSHVDVIKLCHVTAKDNPGLAAILQYLIRGMDSAERDFANKPGAQPIIEYLLSLQDFRDDETERAVALEFFDSYNFTYGQIPSEILRHKWIWAGLVPSLPLPALLSTINRLGFMRLLNEGQPVADAVIRTLADPEAIARHKVNPCDALITLLKYTNIIIPKQGAVPRKPVHNKPEAQLPLAVNPKIVESLSSLLNSSYKNLRPTGLRYLLIVDVRPEMLTGRCYRNNLIQPLMAASILTLSLVKTERSVLVGTYGNGGTVHTIRIGKTLTVNDTHGKFASTVSKPVDLSQPIMWAKNKVKEFDVFIMITDHQVKQEMKMSPVKALAQYRQKLKRPKAKLVVCATGCVCPFNIAGPGDTGVLEIAGFNSDVPRLIEAFARDAF